jgi:hypothetical protein
MKAEKNNRIYAGIYGESQLAFFHFLRRSVTKPVLSERRARGLVG